MLRRARGLCLLLLAFCIPAQISCQRKFERKWSAAQRGTNWTALLSQPLAFVNKANTRLRKRPEGYKPGPDCAGFLGLAYLDGIRRSRHTVCGPEGDGLSGEANITCAESSTCSSAVHCYTAPLFRVANSTEPTVAMCKSINMVLDSCKFFDGERKGALPRTFPVPSQGAVKLACPPSQVPQKGLKHRWLRNALTDVWWDQAVQDAAAVSAACAPNSSTLVTTPTLFLMRDRHANYAHEVETLSMVFSFLAAVNPPDVAAQGIQVVMADRAPPTDFLETWERLSRPHKLRILARDPFPPNTCFRSAYYVYTAAGGIGYSVNPHTVKCESPILTGFSHWLRQLYGEADLATRMPLVPASAEAVAGPAAEAAGVRGLRPPAGGIVLRNVVWLSRRNLELLRVVMNTTMGHKSLRMVRNEDQVVAGIMAAVQAWNSESCLLRRFDRAVHSAYELSFSTLNPVHTSAMNATWTSGSASESNQTSGSALESNQTSGSASESNQTSGSASESNQTNQTGIGTNRRRGLHQVSRQQFLQQQEPCKRPQVREGQEQASATSTLLSCFGRRGLAGDDGAGDDASDADKDYGDETYDDDGLGGGDAGVSVGGEGVSAGGGGAGGGGGSGQGVANGASGHGGGGGNGNKTRPYMIGSNIVLLDKLWELDAAAGDSCRRTNVLFRFVEGDFLQSYDMQLRTIFRTGVLAGVHGAGLAHGYFMPPGQSAVLQLLGDKFAKAPANNVFRNMAANLGNYYEDVLYDEVDVDIDRLKVAVKRAMDFVAAKAMEAQVRRSGALRLVLVDQSHFSIVVPSQEQCPGNATETGSAL